MKKQFLLLPLFGLLLAGCADKESLVLNEEDSLSGPVSRSFLSVNIVSASNAATRAEGDSAPGNYEDGSASESKVNAVRFFFFDEKGDAAPISKRSGTGNYQSYIDWYPTATDSEDGDSNETVEKVLKATLGISVPDKEEYPTQVVAVLNPTSEILDLGTSSSSNAPEPGEDTPEGAADEPSTPSTSVVGPNLSTLLSVVNDFKTGLYTNNFVMSNSVYVDGDTEINTTSLSNDNFAETVEAAESNTVTIFVERVLARLDLSIGLTPVSGKDYYETKSDGYTLDGKETSTNIYVKFFNWNTTCTPKESRLIKSFPSGWKDKEFAVNDPWNAPIYHRSFWAENPSSLKYKDGYQFCSYNGVALPMPGSEAETTYLQENAAKSATEMATEHPSQVIIAAQLVGEDGQPITIAKWANRMYTLDGVKTAIANVLNLYHEVGGTKTKIIPDSIHFATWKELYGSTPKDVDEANYYVYAKVDGNTTWYQKTGDSEYTELLGTEVKTYIRDVVNHVMVWNEGKTYYYFDIRHLGKNDEKTDLEKIPGYYGVVRNHIYASKVTKLAGLGTPVYDPDEEIIPEMPEDDTMLSADVKILQWRVVSNDYELTWP